MILQIDIPMPIPKIKLKNSNITILRSNVSLKTKATLCIDWQTFDITNPTVNIELFNTITLKN